jgi:hypothetical protein
MNFGVMGSLVRYREVNYLIHYLVQKLPKLCPSQYSNKDQ